MLKLLYKVSIFVFLGFLIVSLLISALVNNLYYKYDYLNYIIVGISLLFGYIGCMSSLFFINRFGNNMSIYAKPSAAFMQYVFRIGIYSLLVLIVLYLDYYLIFTIVGIFILKPTIMVYIYKYDEESDLDELSIR